MSRRDREYTPEEALAITLRDVTPHWYNSEPLIVGVDSKEPYPQPLVTDVQSGAWVFFFVSATSPAFDRAFSMFRLWERRFSSLGVRFVFVFRGDYSFFFERKATEAWVRKLEIQSPCVCDFDGSMAKAFHAENEPAIAVLHQGKIAYSGQSEDWLKSAESVLQVILRQDSPGLPLWPVTREEGKHPVFRERWLLQRGSDAIRDSKVELVGNWNIEEDRISTADSKAELRFTAPAENLELIARSLSDVGDPTRIRFDTQGSSFSDEYAGKDFSVDDEGNSSVVLGGPRAYSTLRNLPSGLRQIRFKFPFAKVSPVAIYGIEFGS